MRGTPGVRREPHVRNPSTLPSNGRAPLQTTTLAAAIGEVFGHIWNACRPNLQSRAAPANGPTATNGAATGQGAGATNGTAAASNTPFDAKAWLKEHCSAIKQALDIKDDQDNPDREQILTNLYTVAKELKSSLIDNSENIADSLPTELQADFNENVELIENYFTSSNNKRKISKLELCFLHSYVNHLRICIGSNHSELNASLSELGTKLDNLIKNVNEDIKVAKDEKATADANVAEKQTKKDEAEIVLRRSRRNYSAMDPNSPQRPAEHQKVKQAQRSLQYAQEELDATKKVADEAASKLDALTKTPEEIEAHTLNKEAEELYAEISTMIDNLENLANNDAPKEEQNKLEKTIEAKTEVYKRLQEKVLEAETAEQEAAEVNTAIADQTKSLIESSQMAEIRSIFTGDDPEADENQLLSQIQQQLQVATSLGNACKNLDSDWMKFANMFSKTSQQLGATTNTQIPDEFPGGDYNWPDKCIASIQIEAGGELQPIYAHALRILNHEGTDEAVTVNDKKLALAVVGSWAVVQGVRNGNGDIAEHKARELMDVSAQLLATSLTLKNDLPRSALGQKEALIKFATSIKLNEVSATLRALPDDTPVDIVQTSFIAGVDLATAKNISKASNSASFLLDSAITDRTYENDLTLDARGNSRQTVFKESMLRAIDILKNSPDSETHLNEPRMWKASEAKRTGRIDTGGERINSLLGLTDETRLNNNSPLLDQLVLAAVAHNDLSTQEDFVPRGSLANHIDQFEKNSTLGILKNHRLDKFVDLSDVLIEVATQMRGNVAARVENMRERLEDNDLPIGNSEIQLLVKQIIVTTDAQAANRFSLKTLVDCANSLGKSNTEANRAAFREALGSVETAWNPTPNQAAPALKRSDWRMDDQRSFVTKNLKANPIKAIPVINQIPVVSRLVAASSYVAKALLVGSTGAAGGALAVGLGIGVGVGFVVVGAPIYGAYAAMKRAM